MLSRQIKYRINDIYENANNIFFNSSHDWNKKNYSPNPIKKLKAGVPKNYLCNIDESVLSDLKCVICLNLLWDPMECNECGNSFCSYCINESIKINNFCPLCKSRPINFRKAKGLNKFLNKIRIKCCNDQCKEKPEYFDYVNHLEKCRYRLYHCTNEGCKYQDTLDNIKYHSNECKFRIIKCKYCSKDIKQYNFEKHEKTECTQNIECDKCHSVMTRGFFWTNHYSENDENINCLQTRNKWKDNELKKSNEKIEEINNTHQKEIEKYKRQIIALEEEKKKIINENNMLKKELKDWTNSFKNIYDKLVIKKNIKNEDEEKKKNIII